MWAGRENFINEFDQYAQLGTLKRSMMDDWPYRKSLQACKLPVSGDSDFRTDFPISGPRLCSEAHF